MTLIDKRGFEQDQNSYQRAIRIISRGIVRVIDLGGFRTGHSECQFLLSLLHMLIYRRDRGVSESFSKPLSFSFTGFGMGFAAGAHA